MGRTPSTQKGEKCVALLPFFFISSILALRQSNTCSRYQIAVRRLFKRVKQDLGSRGSTVTPGSESKFARVQGEFPKRNIKCTDR